MKDLNRINDLVTEALALQTEEARDAGALGYMARALVQATMPHSKQDDIYYERRNGAFTLTMTASLKKIGLPYGTIPRLLMAWITTEAVKTKNRELELGDSLSDFMRGLGLIPAGGRWGTITRLKDQTKRLFSCQVACFYSDQNEDQANFTRIAKGYHLWWDTKNPNQGNLFKSTVILDQDFFNEITTSPIVFRMDALKVLKQSSMAVDIYVWTTYRNSYAKKSTRIPWEALQLQFGAGYPMTAQGKRDFKKMFLQALHKVAIVYPEVGKLRPDEKYLLFVPGSPDVPKLIIPS